MLTSQFSFTWEQNINIKINFKLANLGTTAIWFKKYIFLYILLFCVHNIMYDTYSGAGLMTVLLSYYNCLINVLVNKWYYIGGKAASKFVMN